MPSLGKHDPKSLVPARVEDLKSARRLAETVVQVGERLVQFDNISRQRMKDVITYLDDTEQVSWRFYDNTSVEMTKAELADLYTQAEAKIGMRTLAVFDKYQELKSRLEAGERLTLADLRLERWL